MLVGSAGDIEPFTDKVRGGTLGSIRRLCVLFAFPRRFVDQPVAWVLPHRLSDLCPGDAYQSGAVGAFPEGYQSSERLPGGLSVVAAILNMLSDLRNGWK